MAPRSQFDFGGVSSLQVASRSSWAYGGWCYARGHALTKLNNRRGAASRRTRGLQTESIEKEKSRGVILSDYIGCQKLMVRWSTSGVASGQQLFQQGHAMARCLKHQVWAPAPIPLHNDDLVSSTSSRHTKLMCLRMATVTFCNYVVDDLDIHLVEVMGQRAF